GKEEKGPAVLLPLLLPSHPSFLPCSCRRPAPPLLLPHLPCSCHRPAPPLLLPHLPCSFRRPAPPLPLSPSPALANGQRRLSRHRWALLTLTPQLAPSLAAAALAGLPLPSSSLLCQSQPNPCHCLRRKRHQPSPSPTPLLLASSPDPAASFSSLCRSRLCRSSRPPLPSLTAGCCLLPPAPIADAAAVLLLHLLPTACRRCPLLQSPLLPAAFPPTAATDVIFLSSFPAAAAARRRCPLPRPPLPPATASSSKKKTVAAAASLAGHGHCLLPSPVAVLTTATRCCLLTIGQPSSSSLCRNPICCT
ncbi:hypothetical protein GW17_00029152, partial [Ensete ventricosum]